MIARVLALDVTDQVGRSEALALIDEQRWSFVDPSSDPYHLRFDSRFCVIESAETYFNLSANGPRDASLLLVRADELLDRVDVSDLPGALLGQKIIQSRVALARSQYERATSLALEALSLMKEVKSTQFHPLAGIYRTLQKSKYAQSKAGKPLVARLGLLLFQQGAIEVSVC